MTDRNKVSNFIFSRSSVLYKNRYCSQKEHDVVFLKSPVKSNPNEVVKFVGPDYTKVQKLSSMLRPQTNILRAVVGTDIYVTNEDGLVPHRLEHCIRTCEVYSQKRNRWSKLAGFEERIGSVNICSFMQQVIFIGKIPVGNFKFKSKCVKYDSKRGKWSLMGQTNRCRRSASCAVFEGKVVVSGGIEDNDHDFCQSMKSVEAYDYHENKWTYLPDMIKDRCNHATVCVENRMFMIGGWSTGSCEVFDSVSRKFAAVQKIPKNIGSTDFTKKTICVGNKILVFHGACFESILFAYDIETGEWEYQRIDLLSHACVKVPSV